MAIRKAPNDYRVLLLAGAVDYSVWWHGRIEVDNKPGQGAKFTVLFPSG